ncbi:MAG TPA: hypothetical protein VN976_22085 [Verrucomicrobiae bacterium]|nr:hypothetical protein [Verrucomicrobiae bacterium]
MPPRGKIRFASSVESLSTSVNTGQTNVQQFRCRYPNPTAHHVHMLAGSQYPQLIGHTISL